jgi:GTP-binding protein
MITDIRNIAIIAHVDHGKTTLVDGMLKQTHTFRENQPEMLQTTILDTNDLEREKGITILAKNTSVFYKGVKINIIDTPGHADFGGEVERVLNMADGALLVVDAAEGPQPQTRFVLQKALENGLKIILAINKIDKGNARPGRVLAETEELFLNLATAADHLDFPVIYTVGREGKAFHQCPARYDPSMAGDLTPLFDLIVSQLPNAVANVDKPMQMLVSTLDYDPHLGKLGIGRVRRGLIRTGQRVVQITAKKNLGSFTVEKLYTSRGISREETGEGTSGDIIALAGVPGIEIGQTICDPEEPDALPAIVVEEPTLKITIGANTSPFSGKEGKYFTSRQIGERLFKETETNLGLRVRDIGGGEFETAGRGELHLAILLEMMRREGYEMQVSKPQVILREGKEPYDMVVIEVPENFVGIITGEMGKRRAQLLNMKEDGKGGMIITYKISQRNLIGARSTLLTDTRGTVIFNNIFYGYLPLGPVIEKLRNGVLVAFETGKATAYALESTQERGITFIGPGEEVYEGMIVGLNNRDNDIDINVVKSKHLTNVRSSTKETKIVLSPPYKMSLEQALDFIEDDELLEITPRSLRLRKKLITRLERVRAKRTRKEI